MTIRVAVQERQRFFREGMALVLNGEPDIDVVGAVATASELVSVSEQHRPDVVLLEIDADGWDACRLAAALRKRARALRLVGVASQQDAVVGVRAYRAGIRSLVSRDGGVVAILEAVRHTAPVRAEVTPLVGRPLPPERRAATLTARELDVLRLVGGGKTTREISGQLGISPKTVENHKQRMFAKLGVQNQAHAVAVAMRAGLVAPGVAVKA